MTSRRAGVTSRRAGQQRTPPERPRGRLLAERDARLYLGGQITSMVGDSSLWLAVGIWVKALTNSSSAAALVWMAFLVGALTGPLTAVLIDRLPLRPVLIVTNLASAVDVLLLLLVDGRNDSWLVYPLMFGYGASSALLGAGTSALMTPLFGSDLLPAANALISTCKQSMNLIAPVIGAGVFAIVGATPVIIADAATFMLAALALSLMRTRLPRPSSSEVKPGRWALVSAGMRHLFGTPELRRVVLGTAIAVLGLGFLEPVEFSVNSEGLHRSPGFMGVLFACQGAGALLGGVLTARAIRRFGLIRSAILAFSAMAVGTGLMIMPSTAVVGFAFALYGAALTGVSVAQQTQLQRLTPASMQGRAAGAAGLVVRTPQAIGIAVGSGLIELVGYRLLLLVIVLLIALAAGWLCLPMPSAATSAEGRPELIRS